MADAGHDRIQIDPAQVLRALADVSGRVEDFVVSMAVDAAAAESRAPSAATVAAMETGTISSSEHAANVVEEGETCPVCQDAFSSGDEFMRMPCGHAYHSTCLGKWLVAHNTCPMCRHELPVDPAAAQAPQSARIRLVPRARAFCDVTGVMLDFGPGWHHQVGQNFDLCAEEFEQLSAGDTLAVGSVALYHAEEGTPCGRVVLVAVEGDTATVRAPPPLPLVAALSAEGLQVDCRFGFGPAGTYRGAVVPAEAPGAELAGAVALLSRTRMRAAGGNFSTHAARLAEAGALAVVVANLDGDDSAFAPGSSDPAEARIPVVGIGAGDSAALAAAPMAELHIETDTRAWTVRLDQLSHQRHYVQVDGMADLGTEAGQYELLTRGGGGAMPASALADLVRELSGEGGLAPMEADVEVEVEAEAEVQTAAAATGTGSPGAERESGDAGASLLLGGEAAGEATAPRWPHPCDDGHALQPAARRTNWCDICGRTGTSHRCCAGCDFDLCDGCFAERQARQAAAPEPEPEPEPGTAESAD